MPGGRTVRISISKRVSRPRFIIGRHLEAASAFLANAEKKKVFALDRGCAWARTAIISLSLLVGKEKASKVEEQHF